MQNNMWGKEDTQLFYSLSPDLILNSIEDIGITVTGRCLTLNSMENRVYEIEVSDFKIKNKEQANIIAKFYRPGRWTKEQILEEHEFLQDLNSKDIKVNSPIKINQETLFEIKNHNIYFSLFEKIGGRLEVELNDDQVEKLGRLLARVHLVGKSKKCSQRLKLIPETYGLGSKSILEQDNSIPREHKEHYLQQMKQALELIKPLYENIALQRIHGDCHQGNVIWSAEGNPMLVDFDDMVSGPIIQDCWLLFDWNDPVKKDIFLNAYEEFNEFPYSQIKLIEVLRTLRILHFNSWISKRWMDPSFQQAFPHFQTSEYWSTQIHDLREQIQSIQNIQASSIF